MQGLKQTGFAPQLLCELAVAQRCRSAALITPPNTPCVLVKDEGGAEAMRRMKRTDREWGGRFEN
jgi:hypothetical protein